VIDPFAVPAIHPALGLVRVFVGKILPDTPCGFPSHEFNRRCRISLRSSGLLRLSEQ
jgi:hypothetical protein